MDKSKAQNSSLQAGGVILNILNFLYIFLLLFDLLERKERQSYSLIIAPAVSNLLFSQVSPRSLMCSTHIHITVK